MQFHRRYWNVALLACLGSLAACAGGGGGSGSSVPGQQIFAQMPSTTPAPSAPNDYWPMFRQNNTGWNFNSSQTLINANNVATLKPAWSWTNASAPNAGIFAQPLVINGMVIVADQAGDITALSEQTGTQLWQFVAPTAEAFVSTPLYYNGTLIAAGVKNDLFVINAATGGLISWSQGPATGGIGASFLSSPILIGPNVYIGETDRSQTPGSDCILNDQFLSINPVTLSVLATLTTTNNGSEGATVWSSAVSDGNGNVDFGVGNSCGSISSPYADSLVSVDANTLMPRWHTPGAPDIHDLDYGASPVVINGLVIDGSKNGNVYADNANTGTQQWESTVGPLAGGTIIGSLATDGSTIVVPYDDGPTAGMAGYQAIDTTGALKWSYVTSQDSPGYGVLSAPVISNGMVFSGYKLPNCASNCDVIGALSLTNGATLWSYAVPSQIDGSPSLTQGGLFVASYKATTVYRFSPNGQQ